MWPVWRWPAQDTWRTGMQSFLVLLAPLNGTQHPNLNKSWLKVRTRIRRMRTMTTMAVTTIYGTELGQPGLGYEPVSTQYLCNQQRYPRVYSSWQVKTYTFHTISEINEIAPATPKKITNLHTTQEICTWFVFCWCLLWFVTSRFQDNKTMQH